MGRRVPKDSLRLMGEMKTPVFKPAATVGTVNGVSQDALEELDAAD